MKSPYWNILWGVAGSVFCIAGGTPAVYHNLYAFIGGILIGIVTGKAIILDGLRQNGGF